MPYLRKHAALLALALALILILAIAIPTYASKGNGTFYLKDLSGSREALNGVTIAGELRDGYQRTAFSIRDGKLDADTRLISKPHQTIELAYATGSKVIPGRQYTASVNGRRFEISSYVREGNNSFYTPSQYAAVAPPLLNASDRPNGYPSRLDYGIAVAGDRVFYTVPVPSGVSGPGIIYEPSFYDWWKKSQFEYPEPPRKIVAYDLTTEGTAGKQGIAVIGLEAVGGKLALLTLENETLRIRSYDSESGQSLGEARLPGIRLSADAGDPDAYGYDYQSSSEEDNGRLFLNFKGSSGTHSLLLSVNLSEGVRIENAARVEIEDSAMAASRSFTAMSERNGKLYVFKAAQERRDDQTPAQLLDIALPVHAYLLVFEQSNLIYQGELISDINDDMIEAINRPSQDYSFGYSDIEFRTFKNIEID